MTPARRIALFGGTFDPIHLGHLEIASRAVAAMQLDQVRFLPCQISPHKTGHPPTAFGERLAMLHLALQGLPWAVVDDFELHAPKPSYSHLTVIEMRRRFPDAQLFWLLGRDQWDALPRWKHPEKLAAALEFIVFARDGQAAPRQGWRMHPIAGTHPASSSAIRTALHDHHPLPEWLPSAVLSYIREHSLYLP